MEEVIGLLEKNPMGAFATVDNGKPQVRPWGFMFAESGRLFFCTNNQKNVYKQLQANPYGAFTSTSKDMVTVRVSGKVNFVNDPALKQKVLDLNPRLKTLYKSADNPIFEVFYIEHGEACISAMSLEPPTWFSF